MDRAIELACGVEGATSPNPPVGAVIVVEGRIVGEGATQPPGGPHAEIVALRRAGNRARGATLFVTLEPCSHYGRTPPCADAIVAAGIAEVHVAVGDPNPLVNGRGLVHLERAGIHVKLGDGKDRAQELIAGHTALATLRRPLVTAIVGTEPLDLGILFCKADAIWGDRGVQMTSGQFLSDLNVDREYHVVVHDLGTRGIARLVVTQRAAVRGLIDVGLADRVVLPKNAAHLSEYSRRIPESIPGYMTYGRRTE